MNNDVPEKFQLSKEISNYWYNCASDLNGATRVLYAAQSNQVYAVKELDLPSSFSLQVALHRPVLLNAGLAIELILKASLIRLKQFDEQKHRTHNLIKLAQDAGVSYTPAQKCTLQILSDSSEWYGRYPKPNKVHQYLDNIANWGKLRKIKRLGTLSVTIADESKWPTYQNYIELWNIGVQRYWEIEPVDHREFTLMG